MSGNSAHFSKVVIAIFCMIAVIGYFIFQWNANELPRNKANIDDKQELTEAELVLLLKVKNRGIALLENEQLEQSAREFKEVIRLAQTEPLGYQNLCIAFLMQLESQAAQLSPDKVTKLVKQAKQAIEQLRIYAPDSATSYLFSAKLAGLQKNNEERIAQLIQATQRDQQDPSLWFSLFEAYRQANQVDTQKQIDALLKAHQLKPENLFLLTELLLIQSDTEQISLRKTLLQTQSIIEPFLASIKKMTRLDANELLKKTVSQLNDQTDAAAWKQIKRSIRILVNVLKPEDAMQSDRRRIAKNMLEYIRFQFSPLLQKQGKNMESPAQQSLAITFTKSDETEAIIDSSPVLSFQLGDFNLDGKTDIVALTPDALSVWSQKEVASSWEKITQLQLKHSATSFVLVDLDSDIEKNQKKLSDDTIDPRLQTGPQFDADLDIILVGAEGITLIENIYDPPTGKRTLVEVGNVSLLKNIPSVKKVLPIDFDHDGDLDLCLATENNISFWKQLSPFEFENISSESAFSKDKIEIHSLVAVDWDRDVDLDIVVGTKDGKQSGLLENLRYGRFRWKEFQIEDLPKGILSDLQVLDVDANASWDLLLAGTSGIHVVKTETSPGGNVNLSAAIQISKSFCEKTDLADFDNNGWLDIFSFGAKSCQLLLANSRGHFNQPIPISSVEADFIQLVGNSDFDQDGDLDLCLLSAVETPGKSKSKAIRILHNQGGNENNWLEIGLRAEQIKGNQRSASGRVNHYGIGSLLELKAGQLYQPRTITSQVTHFGIGQQTQADALRILWTNGIPVNILSPQTNSRIYEKQTLKGSCPYLYAWNGQQYKFVTDLLWAAPIGLITPTGELAPSREWEYLLIKGTQLKPHDGTYNLQITEELWEAAYFDTVQLIAIDHPADVQIYSNEKVGPAHLASFGIHTVRSPRKPVSVINQHDDDLLELVSKQDERYAKPFRKKYYQGVVENHYLEIDLGKLEDPKSIKLFLTGWILPSDTSINTAISQNKTIAAPAPLSLSVKNTLGEWEQVIPFTGFPGGKTKTIVLDLSDTFLTSDYRLRLSSQQELYWDQIFYTVDEKPVDFNQIECKLVDADLHYRGFSQVIPHGQFGPDYYEYEKVSRNSKWPPMQGFLTKFGDMRELVNQKDERLVIMGAGDEMTLRFEVPDVPLPADWRRDFILYNVGWDKDADLNTVYGQSVGPLPFYRMSRYPFITEEDFERAASHQKDAFEYHNRLQSRSRFWNAMKDSSPPAQNKQQE